MEIYSTNEIKPKSLSSCCFSWWHLRHRRVWWQHVHELSRKVLRRW